MLIGTSWIFVSLFVLWSFAAMCFDLRQAWLKPLALVIFLAVNISVFVFLRKQWLRLIICFSTCFIVLLWWLSLQPSNDRDWQPDVSQLAYAKVHGDEVVIHNVRNCDYRTEPDYTCRWETRTFDLATIKGADAFFVNWGSPWIAHTMVSFRFTDDKYITFSIETRKVVGQSYSAIKGFFRQYELIYIASDERDVVRLRTNYRVNEDVYLYRLAITPDRARVRFLEYVERLNELHDHAEWYNAVTRNCTTSIFAQREASTTSYLRLGPRDWQVLLNGKLDEKAYREGAFVGDLPFTQLKSRAHINEAARAAGGDPQFSRRIREGRPGFAD
jgi:hypothetical protein